MFKDFFKLTKICETVSLYSIYVLVAVLPVLFLPFTSDVLDFNKQAVAVFLVFVSAFLWMVNVIVSGKLKVNLNRTHIAVLVLMVSYLFSTIFSLDKYGSFWGWPRITQDSFLTIVCFAIMYFLISNVLSKKEIIRSIIIVSVSGFIAVLFGVLQLLKLFILPFGFLASSSFNTIGSVGNFGFFASILLSLFIVLEICSKTKLSRIFFAVAIVVSLLAVIVVNYTFVWVSVILGSALILCYGMLRRDVIDLRWMGLPIFFFALSLFFVLLNPQINLPSNAVEIYLNQKTSYQVALKTLKDVPIFGSGPGTFSFDFLKYKDQSFNNGQFWNLSFDSGSSKISTLIATNGFLGIVAFLLLIGFVVFYGIKSVVRKNRELPDKKSLQDAGIDSNYFQLLSSGLFVSFIVSAFIYFFYSTGFVFDFVYFFLIACFIGLISERKDYELSPSSFLTLGVTFILTLFFIFGLGILILDGQRYIAETNYFQGIKLLSQNNLDSGIKSLEKAVSQNPSADIYLNQLSQAYISKVSQQIARKDLSDTDKSAILQTLVANSINIAKVSTDISPNNILNWSSRSSVYQSLIGLVPDSETFAINYYDKALTLDPVNPYYVNQKGIIYMTQASLLAKDKTDEKNKLLESAKTQFTKAIELKSDYAAARFQLAMVYSQQGKTDEMLKSLEDAKKYAPGDVGLAFQLGLVYYQQENWEKAQIEFERAVRLDNSYANALYFLGLTYDKLGQKDRAIDTISAVLKLNPDNAEVKKVLDNLKSGKKALDGISGTNPPAPPVDEKPQESTSEKTTTKTKK